LLLLPEHYGGRFMVRDLETGTTYRPSPPLPGTMEDHFPIGNEVLFWIWEGARRTVWSWTPDSSRPLLMDDEYAYHGFVTDGHDAVWLRGMNQIGPNEFETLELWTSPLAGSPLALTDPKLLAVMPYSAAPYLAVGGGWAAATPTPYDVRVYRLDGGEERRVPAVRGLRWHLGLLGGGYLWLRGAPYPGSDLRYVARFDIDQLSVAQPP
jgi:hypothetical protein